MKKCVIILVVIFMVLSFSGCNEEFVYTGENADLYTVAVNSVLGATGKWRFEAGYWNPMVKIIERDDYGRTMFLYYESQLIYDVNHVLIISQVTENGKVFYYPDYNFIIGNVDEFIAQDATTEREGYTYYYPLDEQGNFITFRAEFLSEQVEKLKSDNDWNKEMNLDKCISQSITTQKEQPLSERGKATLYQEVFGEYSSSLSRNVEYLTKDDSGKELFLVVNNDKSVQDCRMVITDGENIHSKKINDLSNYQKELAVFKAENGWYKS